MAGTCAGDLVEKDKIEYCERHEYLDLVDMHQVSGK